MTELIWDGKYDKDGHKTAPLRMALLSYYFEYSAINITMISR